ncbi:MAG: FtsX-like permease family protein [Candidatus Helarchaeota archaeon]
MINYFKIGLRYLFRRKFRIVLTILAIVLGVSILMGTLIANDTIKGSLEQQLIEKFGYTDIILVNDSKYYTNSINYNMVKDSLSSISHIGFIWTAQMKESRNVAFQKNISTSQSSWMPIIGVDTSNNNDNLFGKITINSTIDPNINSLEDLLLYPTYPNCCVINVRVANYFNLSVGDILYIYPEVPWSGISWQNSTTWVQLVITGIITDNGKVFDYFNPPVENIWEIRDIEYAIYVNMSIAHKYISNSDTDLQVNNIAIHSNSIYKIDYILGQVMNQINATIPNNSIYGFNIKSLFEQEINNIFGLIMSVLIIFSGISMLVCTILIKNIFEVSVEEQIEEIGIIRAIGVSRFGVFLIYLTQVSLISLIGSGLGLLLGVFISYFFLDSIQYVSAVINPSLYQLIGGDFEIIMSITIQTCLISFLSGITISLLFGLLPAYRASKVRVIEALNPKRGG